MYKSLNTYYKEKFGCKVYKLSLDGGFTCPNRDGKIGTRGCIFCSEKGSGEFAESGNNIKEQLQNAIKRVEKKNKNGKYIAYFQSFTNTYAPVTHLEKLYFEAIEPEYIVGLSVATRPDCLSDEVIALLEKVNEIKPVSVELGLQTVHKSSIDFIRRGYENEVYFQAVKRLKEKGIEVVTHIIIGLPDESEEMIKETTLAAVKAGSDGVKFHLLYIIRGTDLEKEYYEGRVAPLSLEEYAKILKSCIAVLPKDTVVHRITGDGRKNDLIAPLWSADKKKVLNFLKKFLD